MRYGVPIERISYDGNGFVCHSGGRPAGRERAHLALGQGTVPHVPPFLVGLDPARSSCSGIGYRNLAWLGRRSWFAPLEDSPSANDMYRPAYRRFFLGLALPTRQRLVREQVLTSDGISPGTLRGIYQANYGECLRSGRYPLTIMPGRDLVHAECAGDELVLHCRGLRAEKRHRARCLVVALGRRYAPLPFDPELTEMVDFDESGEVVLDGDYSVRWKHADRFRVFVANRGRHVHGLVDANLSLLPVRAATIINSLASREAFAVGDECVSTVWA